MSGTPTRNAVITGAGGAVGGALTRACVEAGFHVHAVHRHAADERPHVTAHVADLADREELDALCSDLSALTTLALLVHAAGAYERGTFAESGDESLDGLYRTNVRAPYFLTKRLLPALRASRADLVFVNSSVAAAPASAELAAYASSRHALRALADAIRSEENEHGIRVTSVFLGRTAGPLQERLHAEEERPYHPERLLQPDDVARAILDLVALPPTVEVTDLHVRPRIRPA